MLDFVRFLRILESGFCKHRPMRRQPALRDRIKKRIAECRDDAFLTREFLDLGGERQVLRALRDLTQRGDLIRLGYGAYARAEHSCLTNRPMLAGDGFAAVSRQVLSKLHIPWEPASAERAYNEGRTTQVPMTPRVRLPRSARFSRKLRYNRMELTIER
jgi:hypothetical protein